MAMKTLVKVSVGLLLALVVATAAGIAVSWAPDQSVSQLTARWAPAPSQFIGIEGMQVHVRDEGPRDDPQPIVLLHGTSASLHTWDGWVAALKGQRRVIRLDLPGFGLTGPFPDHDYTMAHYVRFMGAVLDHFGVQHGVLAGNSFGGALAWEIALVQPQRVDKLILVDAAGYAFKADSVPLGFKLAQMPLLQPLFRNLLPRAMIESSVRNVYGDPSKVSPALIDRYYDLTLRAGNRPALGERFRQARAGEHSDQIKRITQPTLILWGERDHLIPLDYARQFHADIAGSQLVVFDGLGHVPHEEDPARTVAAIQPFLGLK